MGKNPEEATSRWQRVRSLLRVFAHSQNLNTIDTDSRGWNERIAGSMFWHGRAWLTIGQEHVRRFGIFPTEFTVEWVFGGKALCTGFELSTGEGSLHFSLGFWKLFTFYFKFSQPWVGTLLYVPPDERMRSTYNYKPQHDWGNHYIVSLKVHDGYVWWEFFQSSMEWKSGDPPWRTHCFHVKDWVLGKEVYSSEVLETRQVGVPMPEATYAATAKLTLDRWKGRFHTKSVKRVIIDMAEGQQIPVPGKGENSWDCGEDATYSITCAAHTIEEGVGHLVGSVLRTRWRRGGRNWIPEALRAGRRS